jgi:hypothetical protein
MVEFIELVTRAEPVLRIEAVAANWIRHNTVHRSIVGVAKCILGQNLL